MTVREAKELALQMHRSFTERDKQARLLECRYCSTPTPPHCNALFTPTPPHCNRMVAVMALMKRADRELLTREDAISAMRDELETREERNSQEAGGAPPNRAATLLAMLDQGVVCRKG